MSRQALDETLAEHDRLIDALTAERARVVELEAEVTFWQERHDHIQDRRKIDDAAFQDLFCRAHVAAGYPADDEDQSNDAHIGRLFIQHRYAFAKAVAEAAAERALSDRLIEALKPFQPAYEAFVQHTQTTMVTGTTDFERRASAGEIEDRAFEIAYDEMASITFDQLDAVAAARTAHTEAREGRE